MTTTAMCPKCMVNAKQDLYGTSLFEEMKIKPNVEKPVDLNIDVKDTVELSKESKQEIVKKAKTKAAGWSSLFGIFNTLQYGLRSDKKVAKKFNLDAEKDKDLIKTIKREQVKSTLPAAIGSFFGVGTISGVISWIYNKNSDAGKIEV